MATVILSENGIDAVWHVHLLGVVTDGQHVLVIGANHWFDETSQLYVHHREHIVTFAPLPTQYVAELEAPRPYLGLRVPSGRFREKLLHQYQDDSWGFGDSHDGFKEIEPLALDLYSFQQVAANEILAQLKSDRQMGTFRGKRR